MGQELSLWVSCHNTAGADGRQLFGEDDEEADAEELEKAKAAGENGKYKRD
jgi:hypothetical protein